MDRAELYEQERRADSPTILVEEVCPDPPVAVYTVFQGDLSTDQIALIGGEGVVCGNISANHVIVQGTVVGNICARRAEIHPGGKVWGNICALTLHIETGGYLCGQVLIRDEHAVPSHDGRDEDLERLLAELGVGVGTPTYPHGHPPALDTQDALRRIAEARNQIIARLQRELQATQTSLAEQGATRPAISAPLSGEDKGNGHHLAAASASMTPPAAPPEIFRDETEEAPVDSRPADAQSRRRPLNVALAQLAEDLDVTRQEIMRARIEAAQRPAFSPPSPVEPARGDQTAPPAERPAGEPPASEAAAPSLDAQPVVGEPADEPPASPAEPIGEPVAAATPSPTTLPTGPGKTRIAVGKLLNDLEQVRNQLARLHEEPPPASPQPDDGRTQPPPEATRVEVEAPQPSSNTAYCLTCRARRPIEELGVLITPDGRHATKGRCVICGSTVLKLG